MSPMPAVPRVPAPIVVGLDGSEASLAALRWAADEAAAHGVPLIAVHVMDPRGRRFASYAGRRPQPLPDLLRDSVSGAELAAMDEAARAEREIEEAGLVHLTRIFEVGVPSQVLVRCAIGARMLVLGNADHHRRRDDERFPIPSLGSIARACIARATCAVVVVPVPARTSAARPVQPEPERVPVAHAPMEGARAVYPKQQLVPIAHG